VMSDKREANASRKTNVSGSDNRYPHELTSKLSSCAAWAQFCMITQEPALYREA